MTELADMPAPRIKRIDAVTLGTEEMSRAVAVYEAPGLFIVGGGRDLRVTS